MPPPRLQSASRKRVGVTSSPIRIAPRRERTMPAAPARLRSTRSRRSRQVGGAGAEIVVVRGLVVGDLAVERCRPGVVGAGARRDRGRAPGRQRVVLQHRRPGTRGSRRARRRPRRRSAARSARSPRRSPPRAPARSRGGIAGRAARAPSAASRRTSGPAARPGEAGRPLSSTGWRHRASLPRRNRARPGRPARRPRLPRRRPSART